MEKEASILHKTEKDRHNHSLFVLERRKNIQDFFNSFMNTLIQNILESHLEPTINANKTKAHQRPKEPAITLLRLLRYVCIGKKPKKDKMLTN